MKKNRIQSIRRLAESPIIPLVSVTHVSNSDWKTWKNGKAFSSQGKVGKITQNTGKLIEFQTNYLLFVIDILYESCVLFAKMDQVFNQKTKH